MSRELVIVWAGRHQRGPWEALCDDYRKRIARHVPIRDLPVKVKNTGDDLTRRRAEGERLVATAPGPSWHIALDSRGRSLDSEALADKLTVQVRKHKEKLTNHHPEEVRAARYE